MAVRVAAPWVKEQRATARLVRAAFESIPTRRRRKPEVLHALCRLTWIFKVSGEVVDNTANVVVPALCTLFGVEVHAKTSGEVGAALKRAGVPASVIVAAKVDVGFTNFYAGFRKTSLAWLKEHRRAVFKAFSLAFRARSDSDARAAYALVAKLPPLPRPRAGDLPAYSLLTPVLACLDARRRSPILNARGTVRWRLRRLGLARGSLVEQFDGLSGLIGQSGFEDAFALDVCSQAEFERAFKGGRTSNRKPSSRRAKLPGAVPKNLAMRADEDVEVLVKARTAAYRRLHNTMTNALLKIAVRRNVAVEKGTSNACMFDALLPGYRGTERDLLLEVKTTWDRATCRLAVGQLLDYRRRLPNHTATDIGVLFPRRPSREVFDFLGFVGARVMWLSKDRRSILGEVTLP
jgi:hypothetical protein